LLISGHFRSDATREVNFWNGFCCLVFFFLILSVLTFPNGKYITYLNKTLLYLPYLNISSQNFNSIIVEFCSITTHLVIDFINDFMIYWMLICCIVWSRSKKIIIIIITIIIIALTLSSPHNCWSDGSYNLHSSTIQCIFSL